MNKLKNHLPEIWGGIECTINRVDDRYLDQLDLAGFYNNPSYLDSIVDLGINRVRFPVLWEKHQPSLATEIDWSWTEECLNKLQSNNITPIVGLLHHGSGPAFTDLLQEDFPALFAGYAAKVANRFPWLEYYTPVNEPLTTARFSGLYGLWYPHKKNDVSFFKILLNELKATVLAMHEIRKINPSAKFIQTEDLGKTYSTALLSYQADFENHRRWLTYDILCGKFDQFHPLWDHAMRLGIEIEKLSFFINNPCPPDIIGINHYLTSERYLDENIPMYPADPVGGNSLHQYVDIEAVRVRINEPHGLEQLLKELWQRYTIPLAITEAHLNCTRDEQVRWLHHVYETASKMKKEGVDIRAVTAWALLGSFGWNKLLTCQSCDYETGVFDISAAYTRPTALASLIKSLSSGRSWNKHLLGLHGWWKLDHRYYKKYGKVDNASSDSSVQPVIIIGNTGTLGQAFSKICTERNIHHFLLGRTETDICDDTKLAAMIDRYQPWAIINAAGYVMVDEAERNKKNCYNENFVGPQKLAAICRTCGIKLMSFSSDLVFDGRKKRPYTETDLANPLNTYGHSKQLAEIAICKENPDALIIRTAAFFGPWDKYNFVHHLLTQLAQGNQFIACDELTVSPTYIPHLVHASLDLLIDDSTGIWHLTNKGAVTWYEFAKKIVNHTNLNSQLLLPAYNMETVAKKPGFSALGSIKYNLMPSLDEALDAYFSYLSMENKNVLAKNIINERV